MISLDKTYKTRSNLKVAIYAVLPDNPTEKVQGAIIFSDRIQMGSWTLDGCFHEDLLGTTPLDLIEVSPYEDWNIDDKVLCWDDDWDYGVTQKCYFGGLNKDGIPTVFLNGTTSWSTELRAVLYDNIERVVE